MRHSAVRNLSQLFRSRRERTRRPNALRVAVWSAKSAIPFHQKVEDVMTRNLLSQRLQQLLKLGVRQDILLLEDELLHLLVDLVPLEQLLPFLLLAA